MSKSDPRIPPVDAIDRVVHEPARLIILAHLAVVQEADFTFLLKATDLTNGNLSSHLRKLKAEDYIVVRKEFVDSRPTTFLAISGAGREALLGTTWQMPK